MKPKMSEDHWISWFKGQQFCKLLDGSIFLTVVESLQDWYMYSTAFELQPKI